MIIALVKTTGENVFINVDAIAAVTVMEGVTRVYLIGDSEAFQVKDKPDSIVALWKECRR